MVSSAAIHLYLVYPYKVKAAVDNTEMNDYDCVSIKFFDKISSGPYLA